MIIGLSFFSCEEDAKNITLPNASSKISVSCFISPDDTLLRVDLSRSKPINKYTNDNDIENLKKSLVELSDGSSSVTLKYDTGGRSKNTYYTPPIGDIKFVGSTKNFQIVGGKTYNLKITSIDGNVLNASTTVPLDLNTSASYKIFPAKEDEYSTSYPIDLQWSDPAGQNNFYRLEVETITNRQNCYNSGPVYFQGQNNVSDANNDGTIFTLRNERLYTGCDFTENDSIVLILANVDVHYYKFHYHLANFYGDDPFSEPAQMYSNIQGGLGAFGSYRVHRKKMPLVISQ